MTIKEWFEEIWKGKYGKTKAELAKEIGLSWVETNRLVKGEIKCPKAPVVIKLLKLAKGHLTLDDICR